MESLSKEKALSYEMKSGMTFMGGAVTDRYAEMIRHDTEETFRYNISMSHVITCTAKTYTPGVGLW